MQPPQRTHRALPHELLAGGDECHPGPGAGDAPGAATGRRTDREPCVIGSAAWFSEIGTRSANEDTCAFWWTGGAFFAAVADGLGGMEGGGQASRHVVAYLKARARGAGLTVGGLSALAVDAHEDLRRLQQRYREHASMATTLTALAVRDDTLVAAHSGDTRLFLARRDALTQLTEDHSEAQQLFNRGLLTASEFANYPRKNILLSALGIPGKPTVQRVEASVSPGDWLILASDGAYNKLQPADLLDAGRASRTPAGFASACRRLIEARGPEDNYTMVVARVVASTRLLARAVQVLQRFRGNGNLVRGD